MSMQELKTIRDQLGNRVESATLRGDGPASFVFVVHAGKAVEISAHQDGGWWLEFWKSIDDEDLPPVLETRANTASEVIECVMRWVC